MSRVKSFVLLLVFFALVLGKALLLRALVLEDPSFVSALWVEGPFILGALLIVDAFFADMRLRALIIFDAVFSVFMLGVVMYSSYYGTLPTPESLQMMGQATTVGNSIAALLQPVFVLFVIDLVVLIAVPPVVKRWWPSVLNADEDTSPFQHAWAYALLIPVVGVLVFGVASVRALPMPVDGMAASRAKGLFTYLVASSLPQDEVPISRIDLNNLTAVQGSIDAMRGGAEGPRIAEFKPGAFKGKNVIVIQVEALQTAAVGASVGGQEVTPNLNKLISRSWYFPHTFSQVGRGTTSDAEFISNTSLYPAQRTASTIAFAGKELPSMPRLLESQGYETMTFHTNDVAYWNRSQLYPAIGFDRYYDKKFFGKREQIAFGASDRVLFAKTFAELEKRHKAGTPFYAQVITMSSHHPFNVIPKDQLRLALVPPYAGTRTGDYLSAIEYFDRQLGVFLDDLEKSGLADDTVIVLYGDHFGLEKVKGNGPDAKAQKALFRGDYTQIDKMNVPLIVHVPGQTLGQTIEDPAGQVDIMPTIADALGVDIGTTPHFGKSVFMRSPVLMPAGGFLPVGTYVDDRIMFVPGISFEDGKAYDLMTHEAAKGHNPLRIKWDRARGLAALSQAYTKHLPDREGYDPAAKIVLPPKE